MRSLDTTALGVNNNQYKKGLNIISIKHSVQQIFVKYLLWSATEVMRDKVGVIVCMRGKPNPSMCGYDIRQLRHMWPAWEPHHHHHHHHHHHPSSSPSPLQPSYLPRLSEGPPRNNCMMIFALQLLKWSEVSRCPGLLSKHASCLWRWCGHATLGHYDTLDYKHCNGNNRNV